MSEQMTEIQAATDGAGSARLGTTQRSRPAAIPMKHSTVAARTRPEVVFGDESPPGRHVHEVRSALGACTRASSPTHMFPERARRCRAVEMPSEQVHPCPDSKRCPRTGRGALSVTASSSRCTGRRTSRPGTLPVGPRVVGGLRCCRTFGTAGVRRGRAR